MKKNSTHFVIFSIALLVTALQGSEIITTLTGTGSPSSSADAIPALGAGINLSGIAASSIAVDSLNNIYFVERNNYRVRKLYKEEGIWYVTTVAGDGYEPNTGFGGLEGGLDPFFGDPHPSLNEVLATTTSIDPLAIAVDANDILYIAEKYTSTIRVVDGDGYIHRFAGVDYGGVGFIWDSGYSGDGFDAEIARISFGDSCSMGFDGYGNLYFTNAVNYLTGTPNCVVRRIDNNGIIMTVAGCGEPGDAGDGGSALSAQLNYPTTLAVDWEGNLFLGGIATGRIRRVSADSGMINSYLSVDDGSAMPAMKADLAGNLYFTDEAYIKVVDAMSVSVAAIAGNGSFGFSGDDGDPLSASIGAINGLALDIAGNLIIADESNYRIRICGDPEASATEPSAHAPVAAGQELSVDEDEGLALTLIAEDDDDDWLRYRIVTWPQHGTLQKSGASVTYSAYANYNGTDSFTFQVDDRTGNFSAIETVSITVTPVDDAPIAYPVVAFAPPGKTVGIQLGGYDIEGSTLSFTIVDASGLHGVLSGDVPNLIYSAAANFEGAESFTYKVTANSIDSAEVSVTIHTSSVVNLGVLGLSASINNSGHVASSNLEFVGFELTLQGTLWMGEDFVDLSSGYAPVGLNSASSIAANAVSFVFESPSVGVFGGHSAPSAVWSLEQVLTEAPPAQIAPFGSWSKVILTGINNSGLICGNLDFQQPCVWLPDSHQIQFLSPAGTVNAVNNVGTLVGNTAWLSACYWDANGTHSLASPGPEFSWSIATAVNDLGIIAGQFRTASYLWHPCKWENANPIPLEISEADEAQISRINRSGQIVGSVWTPGSSPLRKRAILWEADGSYVDLNNWLPVNSGWVLEEATGINDLGQIVGMGKHNDGSSVFLLNPPLAKVRIEAVMPDAREPGTSGLFRISVDRWQNYSGPVTVGLQISGSATGGLDYHSISSSVTVPAGVNFVNIPVVPRDDLAKEGDEFVALTIVPTDNFKTGVTGSAIVTIHDNDISVVSITAASESASEENITSTTFSITRTLPYVGTLTVAYTISGAATNGTDYVTISASVVIPDGTPTVEITITPVEDTLKEGTEDVQLILSQSAAYYVSFGEQAAAISIVDNDIPKVSVSAIATATEGSAVGSFIVRRSGNYSGALTVSYVIAGTSTSSDYSALPESVVITDGISTATIVVTPTDDTIIEGAETVVLSLSISSAYNVSAPVSGVVTINDNDFVSNDSFGNRIAIIGALPVSASGLNVGCTHEIAEAFHASSSCHQSAWWSWTPSSSVPVEITTEGSTFDTILAIYTGVSVSALTQVASNDDWNAAVTSRVSFSAVASTVYQIAVDGWGDSSGDIVITIRELVPRITITVPESYAYEQGEVPASFVISRNAPDISSALTLTLAITGSAINGTDYVTVSANVVIPANSISASVIVTPVNDLLVEGIEFVQLNVTASSETAVLPGAPAYVLIRDNDTPIVTVSASTITIQESAGEGSSFSFRRSGSLSGALTVHYTVDGTATNGMDYTALSGSIVVASGVSTAAIVLSPINDTFMETTETVIIHLSDDFGYEVGEPAAAYTFIYDNDVPVVSASITTSTVSEGSVGGQSIFVKMSKVVSVDTTINFFLAGSAKNGVDYERLTDAVTIPAGVTIAAIVVLPIDDTSREGDETVTLQLLASTSYQVSSSASVALTIVENDLPRVGIAAPDKEAAEPGYNTGQFTLFRIGDVSAPLAVQLNIAGSATNGVDYLSIETTVIIPTGQHLISVIVTPMDDTLSEQDETIVLSIEESSNYEIIGLIPSATVRLYDDDRPSLSVVSLDSVASYAFDSQGIAANTGRFALVREGSAAADLTASISISGATAGTDYVTIPSTIVIPAGARSAEVILTPLSYATGMSDKTVLMTVEAGVDYSIGSFSKAAVRIKSSTVYLYAASSPLTLDEGSTATFEVRRAGNVSTSASVELLLQGGDPGDAAIPWAEFGVDYKFTGSTVTGAAVVLVTNSASASVTIDTNLIFYSMSYHSDEIVEGLEAFSIMLQPSDAYATSGDLVAVRIEDDDLPQIEITPVISVVEESAVDGTLKIPARQPGRILVQRVISGVSEERYMTFGNPLVVDLSISGTAVADSDYEALPTQVTIPAGRSTVELIVTPIDNGVVDGSRRVTVSATASTEYDLNLMTPATVWILDDDGTLPTISWGTDFNLSTFEGSDTPGYITVKRAGGDLFGPLPFYLQVSGSAEVENDYELLYDTDGSPGMISSAINLTYYLVIFPPDRLSVTVSAYAFKDNEVEDSPNETIAFTLKSADHYTIVPMPVTDPPITQRITIVDIQTPIITVEALVESVEPSEDAVFQIARSSADDYDLDVDFVLFGTAVEGQDFDTLESYTATIPSGWSTVNVTITMNNFIGNKTLGMSILYHPGFDHAEEGYYEVDSTCFAEINLLGIPMLQVTSVDGICTNDGSDPAVFRISRVQNTLQAMTVSYVVFGVGLETTGFDTVFGTVVLPAFTESVTVSVYATGHALEDHEITFGFMELFTSTATAVIQDVLMPEIEVLATEPESLEPGELSGKFTFTRTGSKIAPLTISFSVHNHNATPSVDYVGISTSVIIPAGYSSVSVSVVAINNSVPNPARWVEVELSTGTYRRIGASSTAIVEIIDDEELQPVSLTSSNVVLDELANNVGTFTILRSGSQANSITVNLKYGGSAQKGPDFYAPSYVVIPSSEASVQFSLVVSADANVEGAESIEVTVDDGVGYYPAENSFARLIVNDQDTNVFVSVNVSSSARVATEGGAVGRFVVTRFGDTSNRLTVYFDDVGNAQSGNDYISFGSQVVISASATSATVTITAIDDSIYEGTRFAALSIVPASTYNVISISSSAIAIEDNDLPQISVRARPSTIHEPRSAIAVPQTAAYTFSVARSAMAVTAITVNYSVTASTATSGVDYVTLSGSITLQPGRFDATVVLTPLPDLEAEGVETVVVAVAPGSGYTPNGSAATVAILDSSPPPPPPPPPPGSVTVQIDWIEVEQYSLTGDESGYLNDEFVCFSNKESVDVTVYFGGTFNSGNLEVIASGDGGSFSQAVGLLLGDSQATVSLDLPGEGRYVITARISVTTNDGDGASAESGKDGAPVLIIDRTPPAVSYTLPSRFSLDKEKDIVFLNGGSSNSSLRTQGVNAYTEAEFKVEADVLDLTGLSQRQGKNQARLAGPQTSRPMKIDVDNSESNVQKLTADAPEQMPESIEFNNNMRVRTYRGKYTYEIKLEDRCGNTLSEGFKKQFAVWIDRTPPETKAATQMQGKANVGEFQKGGGNETELSQARHFFSTSDAAFSATAMRAYKGPVTTPVGDDPGHILPASASEADGWSAWLLNTSQEVSITSGASVSVTIRDFAGNEATKTLAYKRKKIITPKPVSKDKDLPSLAVPPKEQPVKRLVSGPDDKLVWHFASQNDSEKGPSSPEGRGANDFALPREGLRFPRAYMRKSNKSEEAVAIIKSYRSPEYIGSVGVDSKSVYAPFNVNPIDPGEAGARHIEPGIVALPPSWSDVDAASPTTQDFVVSDLGLAEAFRIDGSPTDLKMRIGFNPIGNTEASEDDFIESTVCTKVSDRSISATMPLQNIPPGLARVNYEATYDNHNVDASVRGTYKAVAGFRWVNVIGVRPDVVSTGNIVTIRIQAGFLNRDFAPEDFDSEANYVEIRSGGSNLIVKQENVGDAFDEDSITLLVDPNNTSAHMQRLVMEDAHNASIVQAIELTVHIGKKVNAALYDVKVNCGEVENHTLQESLCVMSLQWQNEAGDSIEFVTLGNSARATQTGLQVGLRGVEDADDYKVEGATFPVKITDPTAKTGDIYELCIVDQSVDVLDKGKLKAALNGTLHRKSGFGNDKNLLTFGTKPVHCEFKVGAKAIATTMGALPSGDPVQPITCAVGDKIVVVKKGNDENALQTVMAVKVTIKFSGDFQDRFATDNDPSIEKRGVKGWTFAFEDEPDLDRIIRLNGPLPHLRSLTTFSGVKVTSIDVAPASIAHLFNGDSLIGQKVNIGSNPYFDGGHTMNGDLKDVVDGEEPVANFTFNIGSAVKGTTPTGLTSVPTLHLFGCTFKMLKEAGVVIPFPVADENKVPTQLQFERIGDYRQDKRKDDLNLEYTTLTATLPPTDKKVLINRKRFSKVVDSVNPVGIFSWNEFDVLLDTGVGVTPGTSRVLKMFEGSKALLVKFRFWGFDGDFLTGRFSGELE